VGDRLIKKTEITVIKRKAVNYNGTLEFWKYLNIILSDKCRFLLAAAISPPVWAMGWVKGEFVNMISEPLDDKQFLSD